MKETFNLTYLGLSPLGTSPSGKGMGVKMKKERAGRRLLTVVTGIIIAMEVLTGATIKAQAAGEPVVTQLEVAVASDNSGIVARCSYQNYTDQSGCKMKLYLYKIAADGEFIESQKELTYADEGSESTEPKWVNEGVYRASVTIDDGMEMKQINSENHYRVSQIDGNYIVAIENEQKENISDFSEMGNSSSCSHVYEYFPVQQATPVRDAVQAYQCTKCGMVIDYVDVPNSAYTAFLEETADTIQNARQKAVTICTDRWMSFDKRVFEAIKNRPDVAVEINYQYQGEMQVLIIPAGTDVELLMDENGFGGFRYMNEKLPENTSDLIL